MWTKRNISHAKNNNKTTWSKYKKSTIDFQLVNKKTAHFYS
jgi:hypothetical protein